MRPFKDQAIFGQLAPTKRVNRSKKIFCFHKGLSCLSSLSPSTERKNGGAKSKDRKSKSARKDSFARTLVSQGFLSRHARRKKQKKYYPLSIKI